MSETTGPTSTENEPDETDQDGPGQSDQDTDEQDKQNTDASGAAEPGQSDGDTRPSPVDPAEAAAQAIAQARAVLAAADQAAMSACLADIQAALTRHGMTLDVTPATMFLRKVDA